MKRIFLLFLLLALIVTMAGCSKKTTTTKYTLTTQIAGSGEVIPSKGTHEYTKDTVVKLTATAAEGWRIKEWIGEVTEPQQEKTSVLMDKDKTVKAVFEEIPEIITTELESAVIVENVPSYFEKDFSSTDSELKVNCLLDGAYGHTIQYEYTKEDTGDPDTPDYQGETGVTVEYNSGLLSIHVKYDAMDITSDVNQYSAYPTIGELRTAINNLENFEAVYSNDAGDDPDSKDFNVDYDVNPDNYPAFFDWGYTRILATFNQNIDRDYIKNTYPNGSVYKVFNFTNGSDISLENYINFYQFDNYPWDNEVSLPENQVDIYLGNLDAPIEGNEINVISNTIKDVYGNWVDTNSVTITSGL